MVRSLDQVGKGDVCMTDKPTALKRKIKALQKLYGFDNEKMSILMRMSKRSYVRRMSDIDSIKVKDLVMLEKVLNVRLLDTEIGGLK